MGHLSVVPPQCGKAEDQASELTMLGTIAWHPEDQRTVDAGPGVGLSPDGASGSEGSQVAVGVGCERVGALLNCDPILFSF